MSIEKGTLFKCDRRLCKNYHMVGNDWGVELTPPTGWLAVRRDRNHAAPWVFCSETCLYEYLDEIINPNPKPPFGEKSIGE